MHDKLSQAVRLYDQLLSAQVAHPPRRNTVTSGSTYPSALRQVGPDTWTSPPQVSSPTWASPQTQPAVYAQIRPPSPRVSHTPPSFITPVSHPIGHHPVSLPSQPTQVVDSMTLQAAPNQGYTEIPTSSYHSPFSPQQGVNPVGNLRTFSPLRQGVANTGPSPLPSFPTAPTLAPQSSYMPSVPQSAIQQPERQEALLIDL
jgi:growth factor-regulated tyrosine kinase substrate